MQTVVFPKGGVLLGVGEVKHMARFGLVDLKKINK